MQKFHFAYDADRISEPHDDDKKMAAKLQSFMGEKNISFSRNETWYIATLIWVSFFKSILIVKQNKRPQLSWMNRGLQLAPRYFMNVITLKRCKIVGNKKEPYVWTNLLSNHLGFFFEKHSVWKSIRKSHFKISTTRSRFETKSQKNAKVSFKRSCQNLRLFISTPCCFFQGMYHLKNVHVS